MFMLHFATDKSENISFIFMHCFGGERPGWLVSGGNCLFVVRQVVGGWGLVAVP